MDLESYGTGEKDWQQIKGETQYRHVVVTLLQWG